MRSSSGVYWSSAADGKRCSFNVITRGGVETRTGLLSCGVKIELSNRISRGAALVPAGKINQINTINEGMFMK